MKTIPTLRLVAALLLVAPALSLPGADGTKKPQTIESKLQQLRQGETAEQRTVRHEQEFKDAEAKVNAAAKDLPLLTAAGWQEKQAKFQGGLARLKDEPEFQRKALVSFKLEPGKRPVPKAAAELRAERLNADLALMRKQAEKVLETQPELRDYVGQALQWHQQLFTLAGKYSDNPKVRELVTDRMGSVAEPPVAKR